MEKKPPIKVTLPVDFEILRSDRKSLLSSLQEAFTTEVNREVIRLKFSPTKREIVSLLSDPSSVLSLIIHIPSYYKPLTAYGKARDIEQIENKKPPQFRMTVDLVEMQKKERKLLTEYAKWVRWRPRILLLLLLAIVVLTGSAIGYGYFLVKEDLRLREKIRDAGAESEIAVKKLSNLLDEKSMLEMELMALEQRLSEQIENETVTEKQVIEIRDPAREEERKELVRRLEAAEKEKGRLRKQVEALREAKGKLRAQIAARTAVPAEEIIVTFKNGQTVSGKLIESNEDHIKLKIGYRPVTLTRKLVKSVEFITPNQKRKRHDK